MKNPLITDDITKDISLDRGILAFPGHKIDSPKANFIKHNITRCREKMTEEQFKAILNELECRMQNAE